MRPAFYADIDRTRAAQLGLNANTIATNHQCQPEFVGAGVAQFLDRPDFGNSLLSRGADAGAQSQLAERRSAIRRFPPRIAASGRPVPGLLSNVATFKRDTVPTNANQTNIQPVYDVYASVQGRDLGSVAARHQQDRRRAAAAADARQLDPGRRPDPEHERRLPESRHRPAVRRGLRLSADGRELPELRRSVRRDPGPAGDALRHPHDAVHHRHDAQRALADGRDHGGRRRFGELDPAGDLRARAAAGRHSRPSRPRSRPATPGSGRC